MQFFLPSRPQHTGCIGGDTDYGQTMFGLFFAALALIVQVVSILLHFPLPSSLSRATRIAVYYLTAITFYLVVWASRLSILFSIVRIESSTTRRQLLCWVAVMFFITALLLVAQLFWVCESRTHSSWKTHSGLQCGLPRQVAIFQFVTDVTSDAILLFAPWPLFRSLVDKSLSRKLTVMFSVCVVTTIVSVVHASFILKDDDVKIPFSGMVEACLSLIVANIPVLITTTIDIVGQPKPGVTAEFSTIFWLGTNNAVQLQTPGQHHTHDVTLPPTESTRDHPYSNSQKSLTNFQSHSYDTAS
ncbi:hypothetical protein MSAN_02482100 [Mycena sanguinolenta]|uniref:Rhodopsin domain-containing protein n=1 Tax=Mycena sanguinolenta TaxID=230812 RepID=A0A8H6WSV4_9AGAR|nr:hypothetical protein MSAN_02482100 [Mycena sanguinolenta]